MNASRDCALGAVLLRPGARSTVPVRSRWTSRNLLWRSICGTSAVCRTPSSCGTWRCCTLSKSRRLPCQQSRRARRLKRTTTTMVASVTCRMSRTSARRRRRGRRGLRGRLQGAERAQRVARAAEAKRPRWRAMARERQAREGQGVTGAGHRAVVRLRPAARTGRRPRPPGSRARSPAQSAARPSVASDRHAALAESWASVVPSCSARCATASSPVMGTAALIARHASPVNL